MSAKAEAETWGVGVGVGGGCVLACVIIRAETIECTQNAECKILREANSGCKYSIPRLLVSLHLLCLNNKFTSEATSLVVSMKYVELYF